MNENPADLIAEAREWCKDHRGGYQEYPGGPLIEYDGIHMVKRLADALEARQPSEDGMDAARAEAQRRYPAVRFKDRLPGDYLVAGRHNGFIAGAEWALSRAAVSDAATVESERRAWAIAGHLERDLEAVKAERDAALAAIGRVRAIHRNAGPSQGYSSDIKGGYGMLGDCCAACGSHGEYGVEWPCPTVAALDGAPEPEDVWEYGYELIEPDIRSVFEREGHFISAAFAYRAAKKRIHEERHPDVPTLQYAIIRRRKAGPWLPVEGESHECEVR